MRRLLGRLCDHEGFNYWITNRIPRISLTRFVGWFSKIEHPWICAVSIGVWKLFSNVDLTDAKERDFKSMHACFTRELRGGARAIDSRDEVLISPCDAIVGACGSIHSEMLVQAKGKSYSLTDLLVDPVLAERYADGFYATLRLTSGMYHRFHAPHDCTIERVTYVAGDAYNVNPPALARIDKVFCRNERAVIRARLADADTVALVPVAAILVASIRLRFLDVLLHLRYRGPNAIECAYRARKGEELGWFEHGSTIIVLASKAYELHSGVEAGRRLRMGEPLFVRCEPQNLR